jgi:hypothetical protein
MITDPDPGNQNRAGSLIRIHNTAGIGSNNFSQVSDKLNPLFIPLIFI